MIYVTGDCHGDFRRFGTKNFPEQKEMSRDDKVIICGDFGGIWNGGESEEYWLNWLSNKPFTICFVDGNHENFDRLYTEFSVVDYCGGRAHKIRDNIYHLMRGYVFTFEGKKFFCFGGAQSHDIDDGILDPDIFVSEQDFFDTYQKWVKEDKDFRIKGVSWWEKELPSREEMSFGLIKLEQNKNSVDYIITHDCPAFIATYYSHGIFEPYELTEYFNQIAYTNDFKLWLFGHHHNDMKILGDFQMLYHDLVRLL